MVDGIRERVDRKIFITNKKSIIPFDVPKYHKVPLHSINPSFWNKETQQNNLFVKWIAFVQSKDLSNKSFCRESYLSVEALLYSQLSRPKCISKVNILTALLEPNYSGVYWHLGAIVSSNFINLLGLRVKRGKINFQLRVNYCKIY